MAIPLNFGVMFATLVPAGYMILEDVKTGW